MRIFTTIFLAACASALSYWLFIDITEGNSTSSLNEMGARPIGSSLFDKKALSNRKSISISSADTEEHVFTLDRYQIWNCESPYKDRADGILKIAPLLNFTKNAEIVEAIPISEVDIADYGFDNDWISVAIRDIHKNIIASYKIGINSAWHINKKAKDHRGLDVTIRIPTVYVIKQNAEDDDILYLVADPSKTIRSLFKNKFEEFRDHRPFALNRKYMEEIRIKQVDREIVLDHSTADSPWRISKPLDLEVDKKSLQKLFYNLSNLKAVKLHSKNSVTLPKDTNNLKQIIIKDFINDKDVTLTIYPPTNDKAKTTYATISNRDVIFELPTRPLIGYKSNISSFPTSVNTLRARNMLNISRANIRGIIIKKSKQQPIVVARPSAGSKYELLTIDGKKLAPDEAAIANLIAVISKAPVKAFISDAATDLNLYGFDKPIFSVKIILLAGKPQKIFFARKNGRYYATQLNKSVVWEVNPISYMQIAKNEWQWKNKMIWDLQKRNLTQLTVQQRGQQKITIDHDYGGDVFKAKIAGKDVTPKMNRIEATYFINSCSQLIAKQRLGPNYDPAKKALKNPVFTATLTTQEQDLETTELTKHNYTIQIAKPSESATRVAFYYAKASNDPDYFLITPATYKLFTTDFFSED